MSRLIVGIDPGPTQSAYCYIGLDYTIAAAAKVENRLLLGDLYAHPVSHVAIEGLACYGRPVGRETFETAYMVGRVLEMADSQGTPWTIYHRPEYANAIAGTGKVTDAVLRQALLLRFGDDCKGGPLYVLKGASDKRSAYAVAVYHLDRLRFVGRRGAQSFTPDGDQNPREVRLNAFPDTIGPKAGGGAKRGRKGEGVCEG